MAATHGILLEGLGGTQDGVIGALAAVGLMNTRNDGRVIFLGSASVDHFEVSGIHDINDLSGFGVEEVRCRANQELVTTGSVDVGKRLRPNYRGGKVVLYVSRFYGEPFDWLAERIV